MFGKPLVQGILLVSLVVKSFHFELCFYATAWQEKLGLGLGFGFRDESVFAKSSLNLRSDFGESLAISQGHRGLTRELDFIEEDRGF